MNIDNVSAPSQVFNYAGYLLELNAGRAQKTAYIDAAGTLTYGELDAAVRRMAGALLDVLTEALRRQALSQQVVIGRKRDSGLVEERPEESRRHTASGEQHVRAPSRWSRGGRD